MRISFSVSFISYSILRCDFWGLIFGSCYVQMTGTVYVAVPSIKHKQTLFIKARFKANSLTALVNVQYFSFTYFNLFNILKFL